MEYKVTELELSYRNKTPYNERRKVVSSEDAQYVVRDIFPDSTIEYKESFKAVFLNAANHVVGFTCVSEGGISETTVDVRVILQAALLCNATSIIVAHNHPSGNLSPSRQDRELTRQLAEATKLLRFKLLDHIIITRNDYYSFSDNGLL